MSTKIISTGSYVPKTVISNVDFSKILDTDNEWIVKRTGIESRRFESISNAHMATEAALSALQGIDYDSIDCIIAATYTPDSFIPGLASQLRSNLNIKRPIPCFDINAACSGFMFALHTANAYIKSGIYKRILVIGSDFNSRTLNYADRSTSILFGDGAGAVVVEAGEVGIIDSIIGGEIDEQSSLTLDSNLDRENPFFKRDTTSNAYFSMDGSNVFKFAVRIIEEGIKKILDDNNMSISDIDYVISHQANQRILNMAARSLKTDNEKFLSNVRFYGNTSSASVPILLDESNRNGLLEDGMKIILIAFGGGLSYGVTLIEW